MTIARIELHNAQQGHIAFTNAWATCKAHLMAGTKLVITIAHRKRTTRQNARYWGNGILCQIAQQAVANGKMYSAEVWHELFKQMFIGVDELPNGQIIGKSSVGLSTSEFSEFADKVEAYAATELGVTFYELRPKYINDTTAKTKRS
jgi:hypothetical protein